MHKIIPLNQLHYGHDAVPPINARKIGRDSEIAPLMASIKAHGVGQALNVREIDGSVYVADGNRRLRALNQLVEAGDIAADAPIDCNVGETGDADELSLALNIQRLPMHEADQYEKFQEMRTRGMTEDQIASRFGIEPVRVHRMVALGQLHPDILDAWRTEDWREARDIVRAFTMAPSQKAQKEVFDRLKKKGQFQAYEIRRAFGAGNREAEKLITFVGREAYEAAGGKVTEDLFGEDHAISDFDLAQKLADERMIRECEQFVKDGWSWAEEGQTLPSSWSYNWSRIKPKPVPTEAETAEIERLEKVVGNKPHWERSEKQHAAAADIERIKEAMTVRAFTVEEKAKSGVVLSITQEGYLSVKYGIEKPAPKAAEPLKKGEVAPPALISNAMAQRLSVQVAHAVKSAMTANPHTALASVLAGLGCSGYGNPMSVKAEGNVRTGYSVDGMGNIIRAEAHSFSDLLARYLPMSTEQLLEILANEAGQMVHFHTNTAAHPIVASKPHAQLLDALEQPVLQQALRDRFDAGDYFKTVPRSFAIAAIAEAINPDEARKAEKLKKGEVVVLALKNVVPTGWLPPELRTSTYAGPTAPAAKKGKGKAKAKKAS